MFKRPFANDSSSNVLKEKRHELLYLPNITISFSIRLGRDFLPRGLVSSVVATLFCELHELPQCGAKICHDTKHNNFFPGVLRLLTLMLVLLLVLMVVLQLVLLLLLRLKKTDL